MSIFLDPIDCSTPSFSVLQYILEFAQTHIQWVSDATQPSHLLLSPLLLPSIFLIIRVLSSESALHIRWPEYWSSSFSISPSKEYLGLVSHRTDPLLFRGFVSSTTVWKHQFFSTKLYNGPTFTSVHDYWKTIALTIWTFVSKVMSLLLNTLSWFVTAFLPRSKHFFILWLQSPSTEILEPKKIKSVPFFTFSPSIWHKMIETDTMTLVFLMLSFMTAFSLSSFTIIIITTIIAIFTKHKSQAQNAITWWKRNTSSNVYEHLYDTNLESYDSNCHSPLCFCYSDISLVG